MKAKFSSSQSLSLPVAPEKVSIDHYLRQPQRLIHAITDPKRVEQLSPSVFRLNLRPLQFLMLYVQPVVDLEAWIDTDGVVYVQSIESKIYGLSSLDFDLNLSGYLYAQPYRNSHLLKGKAALDVTVKLPPTLWLTPQSMVEATGNALLRSILATMQQRLERQLLLDYQRWARSQSTLNHGSPSLSLKSAVG
jgi:hypothetical protein